MNRQPYGRPPQWWAPKMSTHWVRLTRRYRREQLRRQQQIVDIELRGAHHLQRAAAEGCGVLIAPNHSAHYDSAALYCAADELDLPVYFMTAWQVFAMTSGWERWAMQRLGCFSVDREANDRRAFKQAVDILAREPHPLVVFPEGDVFHVSDRVMPFREGPAAMALAAARKQSRATVIVPCGIKFWYVDDPAPKLAAALTRLEDRLLLRPLGGDASLKRRILRVATGLLSLKEIDYLGEVRPGTLAERANHLADAILAGMERDRQLSSSNGGRENRPLSISDRVKRLRQHLIQRLDERPDRDAPAPREHLQQMDDLFFVSQLFSYPGDYLKATPSIERLAETIDKFEEDVLGQELPTVRGRRRVVVQFGPPIPVPSERGGRDRASELTSQLQSEVQKLLDAINGEA